MSSILKGVTLSSGQKADIRIEGDEIVEIGVISKAGIDCSGLVALAGFVDPHTHLRQPGFEASETVMSGTRAAASGGYVAITAMANTFPVADSPEVVEHIMSLGLLSKYAFVQPIGAVTKSLDGKELSQIQAMATSAAQVSVFSDDGVCVFDTDLMRQALLEVKDFGGVIAQHAQDPTMTIGSQMNDGALALEMGLTGWPMLAEESVIQRDAELALETGSKLHVCHVTTAGGVEIIRWAKKQGANITAEVTPHHLLLNQELARGYDPVYKVNPPLRTSEDAAALLAGIVDGTIDMLGTDHAPHSSEKKDCEWENAAFGMIGLESAASVLHQVLIQSGAGDWPLFERLMSTNPAKMLSLKDFGSLAIGSKANITLFDPSSSLPGDAPSASKSSNSPYAPLTLSGRVRHTMHQGYFTLFNQKLEEIHD